MSPMSHCKIDDQLKEYQLRNTKDRHKILELFEAERTWTAAQIHQIIPTIDLSTVYRNLQKLEQAGLLNVVHSHTEEQHYEKASTHHDHHSCNSCDVIECIPCPIPNQQTHHLELIGVCTNCS